MENFVLGKNLSRAGKIFIALALSIAIFCGSVISSVAEDATAASGYDTLYTHVYSPMDLVDGETTTGSPALKNDTYDSSTWKFSARKDAESYFKDSDDIAAPVVEAVYGGVEVSWESFEEGSYTVLVYGEDGAYKKKFSAVGTSLLFKDFKLSAEYSIQVVGETKATKIAGYTNDRIVAKVTREGNTAVMNKGDKNANLYVELDAAGKEAINNGGAIVFEFESNIEVNDELTFEIDNNEYQSTAKYNDCWIAMDTFIYPVDSNWNILTEQLADYYSQGANLAYVVDATSKDGNTYTNTATNKMSANTTNVVKVPYGTYKNAEKCTDGFVVVPLDGFGGEEQPINLIENTAETGRLLLQMSIAGHYVVRKNASGNDVTAIHTGKNFDELIDRSISFTNVYIVSDYDNYVEDYITNIVETEPVSHINSVVMENGTYNNTTKAIPFASDAFSSKYNFCVSVAAYQKTSNVYSQRTIKYTAADGEVMTFGFTVPVDGTYEIAAPLTVTAEESAEVKYSVVKEDKFGNRTVLQAEQTYTNQNRFCDVIAKLNVGDTVWLEATAPTGTLVEIGLPQAMSLNENAVVENADGTLTYNFRLVDYFENAKSNGISYSPRSTSANTKAAWDVGYFSDTAVVKGNEYVYQNLTFPAKKGDPADDNTKIINDFGSDTQAANLSGFNSVKITNAQIVAKGMTNRNNGTFKAEGNLKNDTATAIAFYVKADNMVATYEIGFRTDYSSTSNAAVKSGTKDTFYIVSSANPNNVMSNTTYDMRTVLGDKSFGDFEGGYYVVIPLSVYDATTLQGIKDGTYSVITLKLDNIYYKDADGNYPSSKQNFNSSEMIFDDFVFVNDAGKFVQNLQDEYNNVGNNAVEEYEFDDSIFESFKSYEMSLSGYAYSPLEFREKTDGNINYPTESNTTYTTIGEFSVNSTAALSGISQIKINTFGVENGTDENDNVVHKVAGQYARFAAPVSGNTTIDLKNGVTISNENADKLSNIRIAVIYDNEVKRMVSSKDDFDEIIDLGYLEAGKEITIIYYAYSPNAEQVQIPSPLVKITGSYASVSYDANGGEYSANDGQLLKIGTEIVLPNTEKVGALFKGWKYGDTIYKAGETFTIEVDTTLSACYDYYGDFDGDEIITDTDCTSLRKVVLGVQERPEDIAFADLNADEDLNVCDLLRMSKLLSGNAVILGK